MVYAFSIVGIIFALIMIYLTYLEYRRKRLTKISFYIWSILWFLAILLVLFHPYVNEILPALNIIRVMDLYMILALMLLFALIFYLFLRNSVTERRLEELTRELALKPLNKSEK